MNLNEYLRNASAKSAADVAREVGVSPSVVYQWRAGIRPVPVERCAVVERATDGAVTRRDMRPSDWHLIWPELSGQVLLSKI